MIQQQNQTVNEQKSQLQLSHQFSEENNLSTKLSDRNTTKSINLEKILTSSTRSIISNSNSLLNEEIKLFNKANSVETGNDEVISNFVSIDTSSIYNNSNKKTIK